ncbi:hypothetical protein [Streptosporangium sp. LJ11]|uniref:hypothetical protein n=1 Tax=Streptosporangium sp. LJ11 TaxID=3436927 RepID=UPI003F7AA7B2
MSVISWPTLLTQATTPATSENSRSLRETMSRSTRKNSQTMASCTKPEVIAVTDQNQ